MKILSLHIDGFGRFHNRDVSFEDGVNVVYGKNEAGKSTLHSFIRSMLFGMERQRGRASRKDAYSRFEPWTDSGTYEGWLRLESKGEVFRIERCFQKGRKSLTIINETEGREEEPGAALWDRLRCGLSQTAYDNTISIGQLKCATDGGMVAELRNYIANLNTTGSIALNITKASAYLKLQKKELEGKLVPEAARSYTSLIGEIRRVEQEIALPQYANLLTSCRSRRAQVKEQLEARQREKENLLEKAAKGRQILENSQFTDEQSVLSYQAETEALWNQYESARAACAGGGRKVVCVLLLFAALICGAGAAFFLGAPRLAAFGGRLPIPPAAAGTVLCGMAAAALAGGLAAAARGSRLRRELDTSTRLLQEIFARHLGDSSVSEEARGAMRARLEEFLRLSRAVKQSEDTLLRLTREISGLQTTEEGVSEEIERQQRLQWELEQKLDYLAGCKNQVETLKRTLAENARIQEELEAVELAQDTMTALSTSIRDSFGLYLNKEASQLIEGITGGIYNSMSIDQDLNIFMNTPGKLVPIDQVSSGTMDQIYLAVRLAAAKLVQSKDDGMPLIFDDSFVLYDDERLKTALRWLVKSCSGQIIMFTCHQREAQLLTASRMAYHYITIS